MANSSQIELNVAGVERSPNNQSTSSNSTSKLKKLKLWILAVIFIIFVLVGQSAAVLLLRLYFNEGGTSIWLATSLQCVGFPVLILPLLLIPSEQSPRKAPILKIAIIYTILGIAIAGFSLMYSYGVLWLPVSTFSLLSATQLVFTAVFSYFINSQKFTPLILNSVVLVTFSAALLGIQSGSDDSSNVPKGKYAAGFTITLGASAAYALYLCLTQVTFQKVVKSESVSTVLKMQISVAFVGSLVCVAGLFITGEWRGLNSEMEAYAKGKVSYFMTVIWIAISTQLTYVGITGLVFIVSSLFSNTISTVGLPIIPIFAVVFFGDKMTGVKIMSILIAIWGFLSYIYQNYLDDQKVKKQKSEDEENLPVL